jgi:hypothetical protein
MRGLQSYHLQHSEDRMFLWGKGVTKFARKVELSKRLMTISCNLLRFLSD